MDAVSILKGEFIRNARLTDDEGLYFSHTIPEGTRAVSMNITEQVNGEPARAETM